MYFHSGNVGQLKGKDENHFYALQHICYSAYMLSPVHPSVHQMVVS